jgi:hypothetical protein
MVACHRELGKGLWRQPANERMVQLAFVITAGMTSTSRRSLPSGFSAIGQYRKTRRPRPLAVPRPVKDTAVPPSGRVCRVAIGERLAIL